MKTRNTTGQNEFGNTTDEHLFDREVIAFKTYPNRNTEVQGSEGDRHQDRPVFLVAKGDDLPQPPQPEDRIHYDGTDYEVKSHTSYPSHVEFFGAPIIHDT